MKNQGRGIDSDTDFKRVYVVVTETTDKTRLLIKIIEPTELHADENTLLYSEEPINKAGYVNLHMHLIRPEDGKLPKVENVWMLEDTRQVKYFSSEFGYKRWGHFKPVRYNPETMGSERHGLDRFFATTDPECLDTLFETDIEKWMSRIRDAPIMFGVDYKIPREFIKAYAESKGEITYAMVQPFYLSHPPFEPGGERWTSTDYKKDVDGYIAMFPALSYNKSILESQLY